MNGYWGKHLILNGCCCDRNKINDKDNIIKFIKELCNITDMKRIGDVIFYEVEKSPENDRDDLTGLTAFQMIKTSNITIHFCAPSASLYLDFFSCKDYNHEEVKFLIKDYFNPHVMEYNVILRDTNKKIKIS